MANFMNKIVNYRKEGPGVGKSSGNKYNASNFFRIYKDKFFRLIGLNLIYCLFILIVLALIWLPLNKVTDSKNSMIKNMESLNFSSVYVTTAERMIYAYNIQEEDLAAAWPEFEKAVDIIKSANETAIADSVEDGKVLGFDSTMYTPDQLSDVGKYLIGGFEKLGFTVSISGDGDVAYYELVDGGGNSVAKLTYVYGKDVSDAVSIQHSFPVPVKKYALIFLCFAPIILLGPINLCMARITRDYIREEPSFMMSDMWDTFKKNWWQSFVIAFIQYVSIACSALAMIWYYSFIGGGIFFVIGFAACLFLTYIFVSMHFYVPLMQVTLNLNLRKIYKNALYFTVIGMFKNILLILIGAAMIILVAAMFIFGISSEASAIVISLTVTFLLICAFSLWYYLVSCFAYPSIQKYVIDPYYAEQNKVKEDNSKAEDETAESDGSDGASDNGNENSEDEDELPEYIYHNGRMVHRSVIEQESLFEDDISNKR